MVQPEVLRMFLVWGEAAALRESAFWSQKVRTDRMILDWVEVRACDAIDRLERVDALVAADGADRLGIVEAVGEERLINLEWARWYVDGRAVARVAQEMQVPVDAQRAAALFDREELHELESRLNDLDDTLQLIVGDVYNQLREPHGRAPLQVMGVDPFPLDRRPPSA